jgi:hypothetical protein
VAVGPYPSTSNVSTGFPILQVGVGSSIPFTASGCPSGWSYGYISPKLSQTLPGSQLLYNSLLTTRNNQTITISNVSFCNTGGASYLLIEGLPGDEGQRELYLNSITIASSSIVASHPIINCQTAYYFNSTTRSGGGTIAGTPGSTVAVKVSASGPPVASYTLQFNVQGGVSFIEGGSSVTATNNLITVHMVIPTSGQVSWTGYFNEPNSSGGGGITVSY